MSFVRCPNCVRLEATTREKCAELNTTAHELERARASERMLRAIWATLTDDDRREVMARVFEAEGGEDGDQSQR